MSLFIAAMAQGDPGLLQDVQALFTPEGLKNLLRATLVIITGIPLTLVISNWTRRLVEHRYTAQQGMVAGKVVLYLGFLILLVTVLMELGFSLAPLLGAAGIMGIALGFAAQTSVSNVISGFFLMAERPFVVGDLVEVGATMGRVLSIDMLSVKLRTFDNRFVRIPNENLVKTEFINLTRFPIRRADITVGVAYKEDVGKVREILMQVAREHPMVLMEPEPQFHFMDYGASSLDLLFGVWARTDHYFQVRNEVREEIKRRFDAQGIEIPFPHRTLYTGAETDPFPIRIVGDGMGEPVKEGVGEPVGETGPEENGPNEED